MSAWRYLVVALLVLTASTSSVALELEPSDYEDLDLSALLSVVVTPTKQEQSPEEAPATVAVITCDDIRRMGYRTVAEALASVPGLAIIDDHTYQHVGVRGFYADFGTPNDHVKIMINGQPASFRPNAGGFLGSELIPIEAVQRIEVLRGPGSALYGANAFLGVINIITFDGAQTPEGAPTAPGTFHHAISLEGRYGANQFERNPGGTTTFFSAGHLQRFRYFVAGTFHSWEDSGLLVPGLTDMVQHHLQADAPTVYDPPRGHPSPAWNAGIRDSLLERPVTANDPHRTGSTYVTLSQQVGKKSRLVLDGNFQYFDRAAEFQEFTYLTHESRLTYLNGFTRLRYLREPGESGLALTASVALAGGQPFADHLVDPLAPGAYKRRDFGYLAVDGVLEGSWIFSPGNLVTLGADVSFDREDLLTMEVVTDDGGGSYYEPGYGEQDFTTLGAYLQGIVTPWEYLSLTVGTRLDHNTEIGCSSDDWACLGEADNGGLLHVSNRAGIIIDPKVAGIYAKLMYGSSFRPPSPYHLYHEQAFVIGSHGNPDLRPQTADTIEIALCASPVQGFKIQASIYFTYVSDMVFSYLEANRVKIRNADAESHGLEAEIRYSPSPGVTFLANGSYLIGGHLVPKRMPGETDLNWKTSLFNERVDLGMYPRLMGHLGAAVDIPGAPVRVALLFRFVGERDASIVNNLLYNNTSLEKSYSLAGYTTASFAASTVGLKWRGMESVLTAGVQHVSGGFVDPGRGGLDIPAPEPRVYLKLEQRF
jgi:outer membrane receptor for ferrienterochelin and colicins